MTLISFFDEDPIDNIGDIIYLQPQTCIFLGDDKLMKKRKKAQISQFVLDRGLQTQVSFRSLPRNDIDSTLEVLRELITEYPDSIFDVSGGTELLIAAAGIISGMYDVPMYQRNGKNGNILWQYGCELAPTEASLTVAEVISLHAGAIVDERTMQKPRITEDLADDILRLWEIARQDPQQWNNTCYAIAALAECTQSEDSLHIVVTGQQNKAAFYRADMAVIADLFAEDFILDLDYEWGGISFRFRDENIRMILTKAGMLLELYTYMAANWADDRAVSICLDWDGMEVDNGGIQTRNELDVMLTYGVMPICISCKNGEFDKTALYELETIGKHFAGRYAKKVLVATYVGKNEQSIKTLERRARDMNILPLFQIHELTFAQFSEKLRIGLLGY